MKKLLVLCLSLILLSCTSVTDTSGKYTRTPVQMNSINNSVVALVDKTSYEEAYIYCSGSFITERSVLTAAHCVSDINKAQVATFSDYVKADYHFDDEMNTTEFMVTMVDEEKDLAVLSAMAPLPPHYRLTISKTAPTQGENVILMGHPYGLPWTITSGVVSSDRRTSWPRDDVSEDPLFIQHDAQASLGNSGGPLINYNGELVGVLSQGWQKEGHLSMSVHTSLIHKFLRGE